MRALWTGVKAMEAVKSLREYWRGPTRDRFGSWGGGDFSATERVAQFRGHVQDERDCVWCGAEVDEAGAQACVPVDYGRREEDPPVALHGAGEALVVGIELLFGHSRGEVAEADGGEHRFVQQLE